MHHSKDRRARRQLQVRDGGHDLVPAVVGRACYFPFVGRDEFYRKIRTGVLPAPVVVRIGRRLYLSKAALRAFLANGGRGLANKQ